MGSRAPISRSTLFMNERDLPEWAAQFVALCAQVRNEVVRLNEDAYLLAWRTRSLILSLRAVRSFQN